MSTVLHVNDSNFESEVINSDKPVLVDFSAAWCGPCQRLTPILEQFANRNGERVRVCKLDVDDSPATASLYSIRSVPTMMLFVNGKQFETKVGLSSVAALETMLTSALNK